MKINIARPLSSTTAIGIVFQLADGTIQSCNTNAEVILGCTAEQLIGASTFDPPWQTIYEDGSPFPSENHPAIVSIRTGQPCSDVVMGFYRLSGELVWLLIATQPLFKVNSTEPYGVEVSFKDITQQIEVQFTPESQTPVELPPTNATRKLTVMLVEDCVEDRELYRRYLQSDRDYQYTFVEAELGEEALEIELQHQPDIVLLDYLLPDMDGLEWLSLWQQQTGSDRPPVIALTGQGNEAIAIQFIKSGATDYLIKGQVTPEKLRLEIKRAIAEHQLHLKHQAALSDLQRNQQFIQEITNAVPGVIYIYDAITGNSLYTNSQSYTLLGYTAQQRAEMGADFTSRVMHPKDLERFTHYLERLKRAEWDEVLSFEYRMRHFDGSWRWFYSQDRVYKRTEDGSVLYILGVAQDINDFKQTEIELSKNEERLNLATDAAGLGMWFWDLKTDCLEWTQQCKALFGLAPDTEMSYEVFLNALHPDDRDRTHAKVQQALASKTEYNIEYRTVWSDASVHWLLAKGRGFYNPEGEPIRMMGVAQDINERKQTQAKLVETSEILKSVIRDSKDAIFVKDSQGRYLIANQSLADWLGVTVEEIVGQNDTTLFSPEVARSTLAADQQVLEGNILTFEEEIPFQTKKRSLITSKFPLRDVTGQITGITGISKDITDLKESQQKIQENEQLLKLALESANAGSWNWEIKTGKIDWSLENYDIYGLDPSQGKPRYHDWSNAIHSEDRERVNEQVQQVVSGHLPAFNHEFRIIHPQRGVRWIWGLGNITLDENNEPIKLGGINIDITERKLAEEKVSNSEQHLRRILDSLFSFIGVLSPDGTLIQANLTALEAANLPADDVLGKPFAQAYWWSFSTASQARLNDAIERAKAGQAVRYDVEIRLGTDQHILIDFSLVPLFDANGKLEYIIPSGIDITQRQQAQQALKNSEQQLRKILDSLPVYIGLLTPQGQIITINQTALEGVGLQLEDVVGKAFSETYWWSFSTEIQAKIDDAIKRAAAGEAVRFDTLGRGRGKDNYILMEFNLIPVFNGEGQVEYLVPSGIDIGEREASKRALEAREYELKLITEVIPQQVWTALPNGEVDYVNQRWQDYAGATLEQIQNRGWSTVVHPDDLERVNKAWNRSVATGTDYNLKARLRKTNGKYYWFLARAQALRNEEGEIVQWYGTNTDISRIKQLEERLQQQTEDLIQANRLKDEFLAIVSHELRTPLNPILGWSQLISGGRLNSEKTAQGVAIIERNAKLQAQLIEDLLDVSRILQGKLDLKVVPLNLESVIRAALTTVQLAAEAKSIQIETRFEPNIGQISGDAGRLQQVVWNLVFNAIKFTPDGGKVTVTLERVGTQALIRVQDTGNGIEAEFLPYVFERFRQAQSNSTRKFGGLGLGLAIVRHLSELHGGTVAADSAGEGLGATFSVKLPLINTPVTKQSDGGQPNKPEETNLLNGLQVLIVDDEADSLDLLTFVLEQEGALVTAVTSANEAIEAFNESTPDLIISDIGMPEVDGYTLITQIRELPQGKNLPAIALTAYAGEVDRQRSIDSGFQQHISKPINLTEFTKSVMLLIQKQV